MKCLGFAALCGIFSVLTSPARCQSIVYDNSGLSGGPFLEFKNSSFIDCLIYDPEFENGWLSGAARANIVFDENEIKPYSLSYLIRERRSVGSNALTSYTGGMIDPYQTLIVESSVSLTSPILTAIEYEFEVLLRGVNISRPGQTWQTNDGISHGHTIYSYGSLYSYFWGNQFVFDVPNWQEFNAGIFGQWFNSNNYFTWSPEYSGATNTWNKIQMPLAGMQQFYDLDHYRDGWRGTARPAMEVPVTYNFQDIYGQAKAKYILHVHEIYEDIERVPWTTTTFRQPDNPKIVPGPYTNTNGDNYSWTVHMGRDWQASVGFPEGWFGVAATQAAIEEGTTVGLPNVPAGKKAVLYVTVLKQYTDYFYRQFGVDGEILAPPSFPGDTTPKHYMVTSYNSGVSIGGFEGAPWKFIDYNADPNGEGGGPWG